jgi:hypothetical protein
MLQISNILPKRNTNNNFILSYFRFITLIYFYTGQIHMLEKYVIKLYEKERTKRD